MKRSLIPLAFVLLAVLTLGACNSRTKPAPQPASATAAALTAPTATPVKPQATPAPRPTGVGGLAVPQVGQLQSYVSQIEFKQEVIQPTPAVQSWVSMEMRYQAQPAPGAYALNVTDKLSAKDQASSQMQMVVVDQDAYILTPDQGNKWLKVSMQDSGVASLSSSLFDPNKLAQSAAPAIFAPANVINPREVIDGQETTHYRVKDAAVAGLLGDQAGESQVKTGQADLWISNRGNYVKQYTLDATMQIADGSQIRETGNLLVTGENKPAQVATPAPGQVMSLDIFNQPAQQSSTVPATPAALIASQNALKTVPMPPQGRQITNAETSVNVRSALDSYVTTGLPAATYATAEAQDRVFQFYHDQMVKLGWSEVMKQAGTSVEQPGLLLFSKDQMDLQVVILPDTGKKQTVVFMQIEG